MSWNIYVDALKKNKYIHSVALIGLSDGSYWAYGGPEVPQPDEVPLLLNYVATPAQALKSGVSINRIKYFGLHHGFDGESRYLIFMKGCTGGCVFTTNQLLICALYGPVNKESGDNCSGVQKNYLREPIACAVDVPNPAECHTEVKKICSYLSGLGF